MFTLTANRWFPPGTTKAAKTPSLTGYQARLRPCQASNLGINVLCVLSGENPAVAHLARCRTSTALFTRRPGLTWSGSSAFTHLIWWRSTATVRGTPLVRCSCTSPHDLRRRERVRDITQRAPNPAWMSLPSTRVFWISNPPRVTPLTNARRPPWTADDSHAQRTT